MKPVLITDFNDARFVCALKAALKEFSIEIDNFEGLINEFNSEKNIFAYLICENDDVLGMIQFQKVELSNRYLKMEFGMIREFWIASRFRKHGYGAILLKAAENFFAENGIKSVVLFSRPEAEGFYQKQGYGKKPGMTACNGMTVYEKII